MPYIIEDFFNKNECDAAISTVTDAKPLWQKCHQTSMYILGNSFFRKIRLKDNTIVHGTYFEDNIYFFESAELLRTKLSTIFKKVEFTNNFSRPGFQIVQKDEEQQPSVWHYDNMITCFPYSKEFEDYNNNFSNYFDEYYIFTLMLSDSGSFDFYPETDSTFGKDIFESATIKPVCADHVNLVGDTCTNPSCGLKNYETIFYNKGSLLVQNDRVLHRIGNRDIDGSSSQRITLQTYGVVKNETLYLFW